jgi:hypothetical protein
MRSMLSFLAFFALIAPAHAAVDNVHVDVDWRVTIDPQGHVTAMTALPHERVDKVPQIRARLEQEVRTWQFLPGLIDGKPEETQTSLHVRATLTAASNDTMNIRLDHAGVGPTRVKMVVPRYPAEAIRHHKIGEVVLRIGYDANGHVFSVAPAADAPKVDPSLIAASEKAAHHWTFQPESVGGHGLAGFVYAPFCYSLNEIGGHRYQGKCDWVAPGSKDALRDGETLALNPATKLLTDVAGRTL